MQGFHPFCESCEIRRGSQVVRLRSAKPLFAGSIPAPASILSILDGGRKGNHQECLLLPRNRHTCKDEYLKVALQNHVVYRPNPTASAFANL